MLYSRHFSRDKWALGIFLVSRHYKILGAQWKSWLPPQNFTSDRVLWKVFDIQKFDINTSNLLLVFTYILTVFWIFQRYFSLKSRWCCLIYIIIIYAHPIYYECLLVSLNDPFNILYSIRDNIIAEPLSLIGNLLFTPITIQLSRDHNLKIYYRLHTHRFFKAWYLRF